MNNNVRASISKSKSTKDYKIEKPPVCAAYLTNSDDQILTISDYVNQDFNKDKRKSTKLPTIG